MSLICKKCNQEKKEEDFYKSATMKKNGFFLRKSCKSCCNMEKTKLKNLHRIYDRTRPTTSFCQLCQKKGKLFLDHDHKTGKFRGWLCGQCNVGLGQLGDNIKSLQSVQKYLIHYQKKIEINIILENLK